MMLGLPGNCLKLCFLLALPLKADILCLFGKKLLVLRSKRCAFGVRDSMPLQLVWPFVCVITSSPIPSWTEGV